MFQALRDGLLCIISRQLGYRIQQWHFWNRTFVWIHHFYSEYSMSWKSAILSGNFWKLFSKMGGCLRQMAQYKKLALSCHFTNEHREKRFFSLIIWRNRCVLRLFYSWEKEDRIIEHRENFKLRFMFFQPTQDVA